MSDKLKHKLLNSKKENIKAKIYSIFNAKPLVMKLFEAYNIKLLKYSRVQDENIYYKFCLFNFSYYLIYVININSSPIHKILSIIIILGYLFCLVLLFRETFFGSKFQKKYLSLFWCLTLIFCLPFTSYYMIFSSLGDNFWTINGIFSAVSLCFFVNAIYAVLMHVIGALTSLALFYATVEYTSISKTPMEVNYFSYYYIIIIFIYLYFIKEREEKTRAKIEKMKLLGGAIAHEVRSPIATMNMCANVLKEIIDEASSGDEDDKANNKNYTLTLTAESYDLLKDITNSINAVSSKGLNAIESILLSLKTSVIADDKQYYFIESCIKDFINEYIIYNKNAENIEIKITDNFKLYGSMHYLKHCFFNLLNNCYKHGGEDVKIKIWAKQNKLYFRDNGQGIEYKDIAHIFDPFYTKSSTGTGIGLSFCKMVIEDMGGSISCKSKKNKFTEIKLKFPKLHSPSN